MYRNILKNFLLVIMVALAVNVVLSCVMMNYIMLDRQTNDMLYTLRLIDNGLDYSEPLQEQVEELNAVPLSDESRIIIVSYDGELVADSDYVEDAMPEDYPAKEEIAEAIEYGTGAAKRVSERTKQETLYTSLNTDGYVIRLSVPYHSLEYVQLLVPVFLFTVAVALLVGGVISWRLTLSITKPLNEIAEEFSKNDELHFKEYEYEELNEITQSAQKLSEGLKNAVEEVKQAQQVRQDFFANASHELKTPITSIQGYAELLDGGMDIDAGTRKVFISRIKAEAYNMTNLINDILEISRLELKKDTPILMDVNVDSIIDDVLKSYEPMIRENGLSVSVKYSGKTIQSNPKHIQQIVSNLISNSVKYNKPGGFVNIEAGKHNHSFYFRIQDSGIGIPEDSRERIFERFYRVDKGRSRKMGGTGLGLSIVNHIVQYYNGRIFLESEENKGTDIVIEWDL